MNALKKMPINGPSCFWLSTVAVTVIISGSATTSAQMPNPVNRFGRWQGIGWSDGYHACKSSGCRVWADLPPASNHGHLRNAHPVSHIVSGPRGRTFYDRFDAMNHARACESGYCDSADCDQCDAASYSIDQNRIDASQGFVFDESANQEITPDEYPTTPVKLPTFSGPPKPEFVNDQVLDQSASQSSARSAESKPTPKAKPTPAAKPVPPAKPTRPAPPIKEPEATDQDASTDGKPALVAPLANAKRPTNEKPRRLGQSSVPVREVSVKTDANRRPSRLGRATKTAQPQVESMAIDSVDPPQRAGSGIRIVAPQPQVHANPFVVSEPTTGVARRPSTPNDSTVR